MLIFENNMNAEIKERLKHKVLQRSLIWIDQTYHIQDFLIENKQATHFRTNFSETVSCTFFMWKCLIYCATFYDHG